MRLAVLADIPGIVDMIEDLRAAVSGPLPVDRSWASQTLVRLMSSEDGYVAVTDGGFIAGVMQPTVINPAPVAKELGWFARDRSGLHLLRGFEAWAASRGAALVQLSTGPERLDLSRLGYRCVELAWVK